MSANFWNSPEVKETPTKGQQCSMFHSFLFGPYEQCDNASEVEIRQGCVHEHVHESYVCQSCADGMLRQKSFCNECTDSDDSHECPVLTEVVGPAVIR